MTARRPNYEALAMLANGPESQVDPLLAKMLRELAPSAVDQLADISEGVSEEEAARVRTGLHKALDYAVHGALGSGFVITAIRLEWELLGGKPDDPAPWRDAMEG